VPIMRKFRHYSHHRIIPSSSHIHGCYNASGAPIPRAGFQHKVLWLGWNWVLLLCCVHPIAQQETQSQRPPFKIESNVNRVLVRVVLRDKQGRVVDDLQGKDFQVFDNDKPNCLGIFAELQS